MADNYQAWEISEADFPINGGVEEQISFLTGYGILAPSTHNTQPWKFEINNITLIITANSAVKLPQGDPIGRNLQISLGCCVANILAAAEYFGIKADTKWSSGSIKLTFQLDSPRPNEDILQAITKRYSNKLPYDGKPLHKDHLSKLLKTKLTLGTKLTLLNSTAEINKAAAMQQAATLGYSGNKAFFKELSHWLRPSDTKEYDGMPGFVVGLSTAKSKIFRKLMPKLKPIAKILAKKDYHVVNSSSAVGFISTQNDTAEEWFNAGQYYEAVALQAARLGVAMAPMAAIIEDSQQRERAQREFKIDGKPQLFFRLGYSKHKPYHTPRRAVIKPSMKTQQLLTKIVGTSLESKQVNVGKYKINYIVAGKGSPLLLLHGANIGWAQWYQNIAELAKYHKVYAPDLPGAGSSTPVNFHKMDFEKDYVDIVDKFIKLNKLDNLDIVGSSFGGWIALKLAIQHKPYIRKIVLANSLGFTTHMPLQFRPVSLRPFALFLSKTALRPVRNNKNLEKFMRDVFYNKKQPLATEFIDYFYELSRTSHNILFISRLAHLGGMRKELFLKEELPKIKAEVLVIWGKEDPLMPYSTVESSIAQIPNVKLETLNKIGHMPPMEAPVKFNKLVVNFLKDR